MRCARETCSYTAPQTAILLAALLALTLGLAACQSCERGDDDGDTVADAAPPAPCNPLEISPPDAGADPARNTSLFVITELRFGADDEGLDLDCIDTPEGCRDDLCREGPDDGEGGSDNRLGTLALRISKLAGTDLQREMTRAVKRGRHPLLVRLVGATDFRDGTAEAVEINFGLDADRDPSDLPTGRGVVRPDPEAPSKRPSRFEPVAIHDGVLTAGPTTDWMPLFWTRQQIAAVPVQRAYLKLRVATPPSGEEALVDGRLTEGLIAGAMSPNDLAAAIMEMDARTAKVLTRLGPVVRALVRGQADLDLIPPGPTERPCSRNGDCLSGQTCRADHCREPRENFDSISFAIRFVAVSAVEGATDADAGADATPTE